MFRTLRWMLVPCALAVIFAAPQSDKQPDKQSDKSDKPAEPKAQPWKEKPAADWTEDEAKQVLTKSPWAQEAKPDYAPRRNNSGPRIGTGGGYPGGGGGMGRVGVGFPGGGGMGRRGGGYPGGGVGYPGGGTQYPRNGGGGQYPQGGGRQGKDSGANPNAEKPAPMTVRWESALPIQEAEQKARDAGAPSVGKPDPNMYQIAVYGLTQHLTSNDSKTLKKEAMLQVEGMKDIKPSKVQVLQREDGPVILYWFPRNKKISTDDYAITFDAQMGQMRVIQTFILEKMMYNGKLEL